MNSGVAPICRCLLGPAKGARMSELRPVETVPRLALSPKEAAEAIGVGRTMVYDLLASGRLRSLRVGRRRIVTLEALQAFIDGLENDDGSDLA